MRRIDDCPSKDMSMNVTLPLGWVRMGMQECQLTLGMGKDMSQKGSNVTDA